MRRWRHSRHAGRRVVESVTAGEWDTYLSSVPRSSHLQSSRWARAKEAAGWRALRIVFRTDDGIGAGAQLLVRRLPGAGRLAQVPFGPVLGPAVPPQPALQRILEDLDSFIRQERLTCLVLQPPRHVGELDLSRVAALRLPASLSPQLPATVLVDLAGDEQSLLADMRSKTRYNIRLAERRGLRARCGTRNDLPTMHRLLMATATRQGFSPSSLDHLEAMWDAFADTSALVLVELDGVAVSAGLYLGFGDTVCYKRGAWSGEHGALHPNELMHWAAIVWAKEFGYRYFDFEGVRLPAGGAGAPGAATRNVGTFKQGFGGVLVVGAPASIIIPSRPLRVGYRCVPQQVIDCSLRTRVRALVQ